MEFSEIAALWTLIQIAVVLFFLGYFAAYLFFQFWDWRTLPKVKGEEHEPH